MADNLDATLNEPSEAETRIKTLSGNLKKTSEERDAEKAAREAAEQKAAQAEKLATFNEGFVDIVAETPAAKEYKDQLKEKVMGGMSMDDAKVWLKGMTATATSEAPSPIGGSASTPITSQPSDKTPREMNSEELLSAMQEAEKSGATYDFLKGQRW